MRYTVVWLPSARNELARIWMGAADPGAATTAANRIDRFLRIAPLSLGRAQGASRRLVLGPLDVIFTVSPPDRLVTVTRVAYVS